MALSVERIETDRKGSDRSLHRPVRYVRREIDTFPGAGMSESKSSRDPRSSCTGTGQTARPCGSTSRSGSSADTPTTLSIPREHSLVDAVAHLPGKDPSVSYTAGIRSASYRLGTGYGPGSAIASLARFPIPSGGRSGTHRRVATGAAGRSLAGAVVRLVGIRRLAGVDRKNGESEATRSTGVSHGHAGGRQPGGVSEQGLDTHARRRFAPA